MLSLICNNSFYNFSSILCLCLVIITERFEVVNITLFKGTEAVARRCSVKKKCLNILQNLQENTCARVSFLIKLPAQVYNFIKKETLAQVLSFQFCEISKNTFLKKHLWATASELLIAVRWKRKIFRYFESFWWSLVQYNINQILLSLVW